MGIATPVTKVTTLRAATLCVLLTAVLVIAGVPTTASAEVEPGLSRLSGSSRVETALDVSETVFEAGAGGYVLATSGGFADALAGSVLAAQVDGPVLLTPQHSLAPAVLDEIERLGGSQGFIVGGTVVLSSAVSDAVSAERLAGEDRYETAALVAGQVLELDGSPDVVYVTTGANFPDAVSAAALAAAEGAPILLADQGRADAAADFVADHDVERVVAVGGEAVVSPDVLAAVADGLPTDRLSGEDRYATSHAVAEAAIGDGAVTSVWIATGHDYPDALAAGAAVAASGGVLHLAAPDTIDTGDQDDDLRGLLVVNCPVEQLVLVGGTAALSSTVAAAAEAAGISCTDDGQSEPEPAPTCDPSYSGACIPPPPPDLDCSDINERGFAIVGDDPHGFDTDNDGIGCES